MAAHDMWRPPVNRAMASLDRSFFQRTVHLRAARIFQPQHIAHVRRALEASKDALAAERLASVRPDPDGERAQAGGKCLLLRPDCPVPHSPTVDALVQQGLVALVPFPLRLTYDHWTYHDIVSAILPEAAQGEIPSGFAQVGHVAHLNLRDEYLQHKHLVAQVLLDKNAGVRTVINKIDDVGEESAYRTFRYEVLAGPHDMDVTVSEEKCTFRFDYSKVYWNSRLHTEHRRLVASFAEGEAVCDVMAGIGPFAVPAGKKRVFVWANDLNPDSYACLVDAVTRNKVQHYVRAFNEDGRTFIRTAVAELAKAEHTVDITGKPSRRDKDTPLPILKTLSRPRTFQHFVMNLPATATTFLPSFIGLYPPSVRDILPPGTKMPLIHLYCFSTKSDDNLQEGFKICEEISKQLRCDLHPGKIAEGRVEIHDVRDVAPKKRMFCASFRLPEEVAFRDTAAPP